jgi:hypothetical protein
MTKVDEKFENEVRKVLDQSLNDLDAATLAEINRLKYRAMDAAEHKKSRRPLWIIAPMLVSLLFIVLVNLPHQGDSQLTAPNLTELTILTGSESLEFFAEDIEFYEWCSEVMASEENMSGQHTAVPVDAGTKPVASTREGRSHVAKLGVDRVSWLIRG